MFKQAGLVFATVVTLAVFIFIFIFDSGITAQAGDPSALPLLSSTGLEYVGGFRVPAETVNGASFSYGGQAVAYDPSTNSLFISSLNSVAEVSIPTPVNSSDVNAMPFARLLQPFEDPTEGHLRDIYDGDVKMDSLMVYGNRLYGTGYIYFDASNVQRVSHYSRSRQLTQPSFSGWSQVWETGGSGFVAGMMAPVPAEWQAKLGGPVLTGQCCIPINWRTSSGPAAFAFDPATIANGAVVGATPLLMYPQDHATLGPWTTDGHVNATYGSTTGILGVAVIAGTRTVLYFGRTGLGPNCYGEGTSDQALVGTTSPEGGPYCYDPTNHYKAPHAYPYRYQVWAYDLNDFAAVKAGTKQPWDVVPYGVWPLVFPTPELGMSLGGVGYDAQRQVLYVSQLRADADGDANRPIIHTFRVNATPGASTAPPNTVSTVTITADKTAPQPVGTTVTFTAQPTGGIAPYQYKWLVSDGSTSTVAVNWTTSNRFTWTPTESGSYAVTVWVRSAGNAADVFEASTYLAFPIGARAPAPATSVTMLANLPAPQPIDTTVTFTAQPAGGVAPYEYKWSVSNGTTSTVGYKWTTSNRFTWTPTESGSYAVSVWVRSAGNAADVQEASRSLAFPIGARAPARATSVTMLANLPAPQPIGTTVTFTAQPAGGVAPYEYKWRVSYGTTSTVGYKWTTSNRFTWTPTESGSYAVSVWVRSAGNAADVQEASTSLAFTTGSGTAAATAVAMTANRLAP